MGGIMLDKTYCSEKCSGEAYKKLGTFLKHDADTGVKYDKDKIQPSLIDPEFLRELARLLTIGARKYAPDNWKRVKDGKERYKDAMFRHFIDLLSGAKVDPETKIPLPIVVACNAMFYRWFERQENSNKP